MKKQKTLTGKIDRAEAQRKAVFLYDSVIELIGKNFDSESISTVCNFVLLDYFEKLSLEEKDEWDAYELKNVINKLKKKTK